MKNFREYINEEMMPYAQTEKGFVGVDNGPVRDNINLFLASVTERPHATPYHALEVIRKVLAPFHIYPPATNFLDGDEGHEIFQINQFGEKVGMTNSGDVVTKDSSPYFLYFEYSMNSRGSFDIFSEIVNQEELDEILDDVEDDIEDDTTTGDGRDAEDSFDVYRANNKNKEEIRESEEKTMPSWYAKQPGAAHREALKKEKKKEQDKKIKYAIRRLKEEQLDESVQINEISKRLASKVVPKFAKKMDKAYYEGNRKAFFKAQNARNRAIAKHSGSPTVKVSATEETQLDEVGDTKKGREKLEKYAAKAHSQTGYKSKLTPKEKKRSEYSDKALAIVDKKSGKKPIRSSSPLYDYDEEVKLDEKLSPEQKIKIRRRLGPNTPDNRMRQNSDSARAEIRLAKRGGKDKDLNETQLDELSKDFVSRVAKAAIADSNRGTGRNQGGPTAGERWHNKRRQKLAGKAIDKLSGNAKVPANEETQLDEISKKKLGDYVKKASHDVAARSAAVRGFARDADDERKSGKAMDARRSDARADKMFKKSWNRRKYMAKAVDKLTSEEVIDKSVVGSGTIMKTDPKTGKKTDYISPVTLNNPHMQASKDEFKMPKKVPLPPTRPSSFKNMASDADIETIKKDLMKEDKKKENKIQHHQTTIDALRDKIDKRIKSGDRGIGGYGYNDSDEKELAYHKKQLRKLKLSESNPAKEGMIAAGYKGSNPAEQGSIAVKKDDEEREMKANFKIAKKLARQATKEIIKKKKS